MILHLINLALVQFLQMQYLPVQHLSRGPDGLFVIIDGGATTHTNIYDPFLNQVTAGPALTSTATSGTVVLRRPDGRITVMLGGAAQAASGTTYDAATNAFVSGPVLTVRNYGSRFNCSSACKRKMVG